MNNNGIEAGDQITMSGTYIPSKVFFVKGVGVHRHRLASFEDALRDAGIEKFNLVYVSSIFPPKAKILSKNEGLKRLKPGQIVHCVMSRCDTCEPNRLISAAIGLAVPNTADQYGYISEHHAYGQTAQASGDYAEDLAATMLATTLGLDFDPDEAWDERKQLYKASGRIIRTQDVVQSARGNKQGHWTTVLAAAVMVE